MRDRAAWLVPLIVAAALRLACLPALPLILTNDSEGYIRWAGELSAGSMPAMPVYRTPGYPLVLSGVFAVFGVGPLGVLILHLAMGVGSAVLAALIARRLAGARWGLAAGLLVAIDPWLLTLEHYALSETAGVFLTLAAAAAALLPKRPGMTLGAALGFTLAAACLVRPATQVLIPFFIAAQAFGAGTRARGLRVASAACITATIALAPWLAYNASRGVIGVSGGNGVIQWMGLARVGLLAEPVDLPERVRAVYEPRASRLHDETVLFEVLQGVRAFDDPASTRALTAWARRSMFSRPFSYVAAVGTATLWQLNVFPPWSPLKVGELNWCIRRLGNPRHPPGQGAGNFQLSGPGDGVMAFAMDRGDGFVRSVLRAIGLNLITGVPHVPLFAGAVVVVVIATRRRDWPTALIVLGTLAFVAAHAVLLMPNGRFALPAGALWYAVIGASCVRRPLAAPRSPLNEPAAVQNPEAPSL